MNNYTFVDAIEMNRLHPDTFQIDSTDDLKVGDHVKVGAELVEKVQDMPSTERFWVLVTEINKDQIKGKVDNDLVLSEYLQFDFGSQITFERKNIYNVEAK